MSIKISGDFEAKFNKWTELLNDAKIIVSHTSRAAAEVSIALIGEGFENETDPYGERWAPKKEPDGRKVLHGETTRLRNGWHVEAHDDGFTVAPAVEYAAYHQEGTSRMPARKMMPDGRRGLPSAWVEEFEALAASAVAEHFGPAATGGSHKRSPHKRVASAAAGGGGSHASKSPVSRSRSRGRRGGSVGGLIRRIQQIRSLARKAGLG